MTNQKTVFSWVTNYRRDDIPQLGAVRPALQRQQDVQVLGNSGQGKYQEAVAVGNSVLFASPDITAIFPGRRELHVLSRVQLRDRGLWLDGPRSGQNQETDQEVLGGHRLPCEVRISQSDP